MTFVIYYVDCVFTNKHSVGKLSAASLKRKDVCYTDLYWNFTYNKCFKLVTFIIISIFSKIV